MAPAGGVRDPPGTCSSCILQNSWYCFCGYLKTSVLSFMLFPCKIFVVYGTENCPRWG